MKTEYNIYIKLIRFFCLLIFVLQGQSLKAQCSDTQVSSAGNSFTSNGVQVTVVQQQLFRVNQSVDIVNGCQPASISGTTFKWLANAGDYITYTFDKPVTSVEYWLLHLGNYVNGGWGGEDSAEFEIGTSSNNTSAAGVNLTLTQDYCGWDGRTTINGNTVTASSQRNNDNIRNVRIKVESGTPFTTLKVINPKERVNPSFYRDFGYGFYGEICRGSLTPDSDGDGIFDDDDLDDDNDGILDVDEGYDCNTVTIPASNAADARGSSVDNPLGAIGNGGYEAGFNNLSDRLYIDLGRIIPAGTNVNIKARVFSLNDTRLRVRESLDDNSYANPKVYRFDANNTYKTIQHTLVSNARYIEISGRRFLNNTYYLLVDNVFYDSFTIEECTQIDTDGDGIPDHLDLDSDNDGCPDAVEGDENVQISQLDAEKRIDIASHGGVNANGVPNLVNAGGAADIGGDVGQGVGYAANRSVNACTYSDIDNDGVPDHLDLDNDNDGILDKDEMYCNQNTNLNPNGGTNAGQYVFFDWGNNTLANGLTSSTTFKGITYTAEISNVSGTGSFTGTDLNSITWAGEPTNSLKKYYNATNKREAFYSAAYSGTKTYRVVITAKNANTNNPLPYPIEIAVFDPEGTNSIERLSYTTNGTPFIEIEKFGNAATSVVSSGEGTNGVTYSKTQENNTYPVFSTKGNSVTLDVSMLAAGNSKQGSIFAIRAFCDTDGDSVPNYLDTDSDGDGCPDAVEGDENVLLSHLDKDGRIDIASYGGVNADGVPNLVNAGGAADIGGDVGQGVGTSVDATQQDGACNKVIAQDDTYTAQQNIGYVTSPITHNDTVNGASVVLGTAPGELTLTSVGTWNPGITLDTATGKITVSKSIAPGTYQVNYQLCLNGVNPPNCDSATVTITVTPCNAGDTAPVINS